MAQTRNAPLASQHTGCSSRLLSRQLVAVNTLTRTGWHPRRAPPQLEQPLCPAVVLDSVLACGGAVAVAAVVNAHTIFVQLSLCRGDARTASERSWPGAEARASGPLALVVKLPDRGREHRPNCEQRLFAVGIRVSSANVQWRPLAHTLGWVEQIMWRLSPPAMAARQILQTRQGCVRSVARNSSQRWASSITLRKR
jgi:hypothetical protein